MKKVVTRMILILLFAGFAKAVGAQTVREFTLPDIQNNSVQYSTVAGEQLTILDFWTSWCKPCMKGMPKMEEIYQTYKSEGVQVIGINCDGPRSISKVAPLCKTLSISYPVLTDINNDLMKDLEVSSFPTVLIINSKNKIVYRHEGFVSGDEHEIARAIDKQLKKN